MAILRRLCRARSAHVVLAGLFVACLAAVAVAQEVIDREYDIKAAILYNLAKKTTWPKSAFRDQNQPFVIAILEPNRFGNRFAGRKLLGRPLVVQTVADVSKLPDCQVLFVPSARAESLPQVLKAVAGKPILLCGDGPGFAQRGVMVNMVERENSIRIEVNLKAAEAADLAISAEVLKLTTVTVVDK